MGRAEFKCIKQRVAVAIDNHDDAKALVREVDRLRAALVEIKDMTGDPAVINVIGMALEDLS